MLASVSEWHEESSEKARKGGTRGGARGGVASWSDHVDKGDCNEAVSLEETQDDDKEAEKGPLQTMDGVGKELENEAAAGVDEKVLLMLAASMLPTTTLGVHHVLPPPPPPPTISLLSRVYSPWFFLEQLSTVMSRSYVLLVPRIPL